MTYLDGKKRLYAKYSSGNALSKCVHNLCALKTHQGTRLMKTHGARLKKQNPAVPEKAFKAEKAFEVAARREAMYLSHLALPKCLTGRPYQKACSPTLMYRDLYAWHTILNVLFYISQRKPWITTSFWGLYATPGRQHHPILNKARKKPSRVDNTCLIEQITHSWGALIRGR